MDNRRKIKEETIEYFEEIDDEGERRIRVVTKTKVFFPDDTDTRHNPTRSTTVEYL